MPKYIALLRGINVSGHKIIKMDQLRGSLTALGFSDVATYVQSGNVVFEAGVASAIELSRKIEQKIRRDFGFAVPVFIVASKEMEETIKRCPFLKAPEIDVAKLHVTFLASEPPENAVERLQSLPTTAEKFRVIGRQIYLYCPDGYGNTKLSNTAIEKKLSVGATTRNWNTVNTLLAMTR